MAFSRILPTWLTLVAVATLVSSSSAQRTLPIPKTNMGSFGEIKAVRNGVLQVANPSGDEWLVMVEPGAKEVVLRGTAVPQWLRPGMAVRFQGEFSQTKAGQPQGEAKAPITELQVFTPRAGSRMAAKEVPKSDLPLSDRTERPDPNAEETARFNVVGVLAQNKGGRIKVAVGNLQIQARLASDAKIDVEVADPRLARQGDEIDFAGWHYVGQEDRIHATKVSITVVRTLGEEKTRNVAQSQATKDVGGVSGAQRAAARNIQAAITRAKREYVSGDIDQAIGAVSTVIAQWNSFIESDAPVAARLLQPHHKQLQQVYAFLEMDGYTLPKLPELPALKQ